MKLISLFNKSLLTLLTSLFFTGFAVAGDIREIEIGGISIGNSLLELFTKKEIQEMSYAPDHSNMKKSNYRQINIESDSNLLKDHKEYDHVVVVFDKNQNLIINSVSGRKEYKNNNISSCYKNMQNISNDITNITKLEGQNLGKDKYTGDKSGKSFKTIIAFEDKVGNILNITCYDFSEDMPWPDTLSIAIASKEFAEWNRTKGFN